MTGGFIFLAIGLAMIFVTLLVYQGGAVWSKDGTEYQRDQQPGSFWSVIVVLTIVSAVFLLKGAIYLFRFIEKSN